MPQSEQLKKTFIQHSLDEIRQQIICLSAQPQPLEVVTSDLDILMKRYNSEQNYLSRLALWYSEQAWWQKMFLWTGIVGAVLLTTLVLHAVALMTVTAVICINLLAGVLCAGIIALLYNQASTDKKRCEQMCVDVKQLEANLKTSTQSFEAVQVGLALIWEETDKTNAVLSDYAQTLEQHIVELNLEIENLKTIISDLTAAKETLKTNTKEVCSSGQALTQGLSSLQTLITDNMAQIIEADEQLTHSAKECAASNSFLSSITHTLGQLYQAFNNRVEESEKNTQLASTKTLAANEAFIEISKALDRTAAREVQINQQYEKSAIVHATAHELFLQAQQACNEGEISIVQRVPEYNQK